MSSVADVHDSAAGFGISSSGPGHSRAIPPATVGAGPYVVSTGTAARLRATGCDILVDDEDWEVADGRPEDVVL